MERIDEEIYRLKHLINLEKRDDFLMYQEFIKNSTLEQRRYRGICWQPLKIIDSGYGVGDYPYLEIERTKNLGASHQFSAGKMVSIYLVNGDGEYDSVNGTVYWVEKNKMKVILNADDFPGWVHHGSIGVNLLFDEKTYKEMDRALEALLDKENKRCRELLGKSIGVSELSFSKSENIEIPTLNDSQNNALNQVIASNDIAVVHGPPGTGKTTTMVQVISQLVKREKQVLVCAPSNAACDLLAEKLSEKELNVVRIGNLSRIDPEILQLTLEDQISGHARAKEIKQVKRKAVELRSLAGKYKRNFGKSEREQRKLLYREAKAYANEAVELENFVIEDILETCDVICTTLVGSNHKYLKGRLFKTVVIDEAAQSLEPACWIPILKAEKVVLAGDPHQLPPTVKSREAQKEGLDITLIEKCLQNQPEVSLLTTQYRMNSAIMEFSNRQFYAGQLMAHESVANHTLNALSNFNTTPVHFIDTAGTGFQEESNSESRSLENKGEQELVKKLLEDLVNDTEFEQSTSIGVISPYKNQVIALNDLIIEEFTSSYDVTINTIDSFQGQERDVIIISMVRSNDTGEIGFLSDLRRMNVAMTRAKKKLIIIGDSATLASNEFFNNFLSYTEESGTYQSAFELIYD